MSNVYMDGEVLVDERDKYSIRMATKYTQKHKTGKVIERRCLGCNNSMLYNQKEGNYYCPVCER